MADDLPTLLQEIMDLTDITQGGLAKRLGVTQSTINRWLRGQCEPSATKVEKVKAEWRKVKGIKFLSLDQKVAPYDHDTQETIHRMVDNYLRALPPPSSRR